MMILWRDFACNQNINVIGKKNIKKKFSWLFDDFCKPLAILRFAFFVVLILMII